MYWMDETEADIPEKKPDPNFGDNTSDSNIEVVNNHIYFYSGIKSNSILKLNINIGNKKLIIVSEIAKSYDANKIIGKTLTVFFSISSFNELPEM